MTKTTLHDPFAGVLVLPTRQVFGTVAPVLSGTGETLAMIRWHRWTMRAQFDVLTSPGEEVVASGAREGFWGRRYALTAPGGERLVVVRLGGWGVGKPTIVLPDGAELSGRGNWSARKFAITNSSGELVARLATTNSALSLRGPSFAMELLLPVLSIVQAAGLAQCLRAAIEEQNSSAAGAAATG